MVYGEAGGRIPPSMIFDRQHGACGVLDCGFPGVCLTIHPDPNPFADVGSTPSFSIRQQKRVTRTLFVVW